MVTVYLCCTRRDDSGKIKELGIAGSRMEAVSFINVYAVDGEGLWKAAMRGWVKVVRPKFSNGVPDQPLRLTYGPASEHNFFPGAEDWYAANDLDSLPSCDTEVRETD
jgi:hypothetical protein